MRGGMLDSLGGMRDDMRNNMRDGICDGMHGGLCSADSMGVCGGCVRRVWRHARQHAQVLVR